ncbi:MAG: AzlD domain-containing protein [Geminicoccaceae bacterium]|nr:AzlD domain-containing protein [Geminicoccaceae bacterium]
MALATYLTRVAGAWFVRRVALRGRASGALEAVPGAVLVALIAPTVLATGPAESLAALVTLAAARRLPLVLAVLLGVAAVVACRALLG